MEDSSADRFPPVKGSTSSTAFTASSTLFPLDVMGAATLSSTVVMDDPRTPLYIPAVCNSYDQEFQHQLPRDNYYVLHYSTDKAVIIRNSSHGQQQTSVNDEKLNNQTIDYSEEQILSSASSLDTVTSAQQSPVQGMGNGNEDSIELPDLFECLENVPFDFEQYRMVFDDDKVMDEQLAVPALPSAPEDLGTPDVEALGLAASLAGLSHAQLVLLDDDVMEAAMDSTDLLDLIHGPEEAADVRLTGPTVSRHELSLPLVQDAAPSQDDVTTPVLIELLLQEDGNVPDTLQLVGGDTCSIESEVDGRSPSPAGLEQEEAAPPTPAVASRRAAPKRRRHTTTASTSSSVSASTSKADLRRIRNNEASKKSRSNRRRRLEEQVLQVAQLEEQNSRLTDRVGQLERLKAQIMSYVTERLTADKSNTST